jgi:glutamyl-tRNA synthetase
MILRLLWGRSFRFEELMNGVRFAPSPTGRFHVGNLRTAWISNQIARHLNLPWVVRFEDIDRPRVIAGAMKQQLEDLKALGLSPDACSIQSENRERHQEIFKAAQKRGMIYPCDCSRAEVQSALRGLASAPHGPDLVYSGHCRELDPNRVIESDSWGWRLRCEGPENLNPGFLDFLIAREEKNHWSPSYHWACAVDDVCDQEQWIVRAWDLASAVSAQKEIWNCVRSLGWAEKSSDPKIYHTSLVVQDSGQRLEKRTAGVTLDQLSANGVGVDLLRKRFIQSWDISMFDVTASVGGEVGHTLKLSNLLGF